MLPHSHHTGYKRPSPDWNVRNADVTALDKLVVIGVVMDPMRPDTDDEVQGKEHMGEITTNSQLRRKKQRLKIKG